MRWNNYFIVYVCRGTHETMRCVKFDTEFTFMICMAFGDGIWNMFFPKYHL